jgi:hypothetical protein
LTATRKSTILVTLGIINDRHQIHDRRIAMNRAAALIVGISAVVCAAGCGSTTAELPVRTQHVAGTPFQEWKTFRFAQGRKSADSSDFPRFEEMTKKALQKELEGRGYTRIEDGAADFRVGYELSFRGEKVHQAASSGGSAEPEARGYSNVRSTGSLTVRMLDPTTSEALWTGRIGDIQLRSIETSKEIERIVWRVLAEFPPITG